MRLLVQNYCVYQNARLFRLRRCKLRVISSLLRSELWNVLHLQRGGAACVLPGFPRGTINEAEYPVAAARDFLLRRARRALH